MTSDRLALASRLKEARGAAQLTQEQAASALEMSKDAIVQIEAGNRSVSTLELARLAEIYRRSISSFFDLAPANEDCVLSTLLRAVDLLCTAGTHDPEIANHVLSLTLEAYRQEKITQGKLRDLSSLLGMPVETLLALAEAA